MPQPPDDLARELRAAVLASDHANATRLTIEYTEALREYWTALSAAEQVASTLPKQSLELLNWVRDMALMHHAIASRQLAMVEAAQRNQAVRSLYSESATLEAR